MLRLLSRSNNTSDQSQSSRLPRPQSPLQLVELARIGFVALACLASWFQLWRPFASFDVIALVATLVGGYPIFKKAFENLLSPPDDDGTLHDHRARGGSGHRGILHSVSDCFFVLIAEVVEGLTAERGRRAIRNLLNLLPNNALVRRAGETQAVETTEIQKGEIVIVKPGSRCRLTA